MESDAIKTVNEVLDSSLDEVDDIDWEEFPLFAPSGIEIPKLTPEEASQKSSAFGALSHLIHDQETPEEQAELLRDKANRAFRRGDRTRLLEAVSLYTQALDCNPTQIQVLSSTYNNRAAAHLKLGNYRYAADDATKVLEYEPDNIKALYRKSMALVSLEKPAEALDCIEIALKGVDIGGNAEQRALVKLRETALKKKLEFEARERARMNRERELATSQTRWAARLFERNVVLGRNLFAQQRQMMSSRYPKLGDDNQSIIWPVLIVYPEELSQEDQQHTEFIEDWHETTAIKFQIARLFGADADLSALEVLYRQKWTSLAPFEWYTPEAENTAEYQNGLIQKFGLVEHDELYVGSVKGPDDVGDWVSVDMSSSLQSAISRKDYIVPGFPVLYVVPRGFRPKR
mmetsp:Transcript_2248/g.3957  ORF Transcript_2248/g.3957 Transcript_2248/m.3957 type:complete len:402 (-) Transcript_2248:750-1955(-)